MPGWMRSTSAKLSATICSIGVAGARKTAFSKVGCGNAFRSSLPFMLSGSASSSRKAEGTM
ncbi:hypothetical protein NRB56_76200 [Nocardia sp. RB56]|uniref:Uncharacterized protein n=1 Tax=Nocardia aurantia TaxID=2585199 RepID=A0A7K0E1P0_9NOCA|nr:hypothetical protein [Nocardia aurantia]